MNKITTEEQDKFLEELTALSRKHGIVIGGCGCCDSPWLEKMDPEEYDRCINGFWCYSVGTVWEDETNNLKFGEPRNPEVEESLRKKLGG